MGSVRRTKRLSSDRIRKPSEPFNINEFACFKHPMLGPEAWAQVSNGYPKDDGVAAHLTCRFVCSRRDTCPVTKGSDIIGGLGWYTHMGEFRKTPGDGSYIDAVYAAFYIGISTGHLNVLLKRENLTSTLVSSRRIMLVSDMMELAKRYGPRHGTVHRYDLHMLHGEKPCFRCALAAKYLNEEQQACESSSTQR